MPGDETAYLGRDGEEVSRLDFDNQVATEDVDDVPANLDLNPVTSLDVPLLEGRVEVAFVERADGGCDAGLLLCGRARTFAEPRQCMRPWSHSC